MLMGTLKETLIFLRDDETCFYRYEIYKNERRGGHFAIIYRQKTSAANDDVHRVWEIANPLLTLKSNYIPNARVECESHWKAQYRVEVE